MCNAKCNALSAANAKAWISHFSLHAAHMAGMKIEESLAAEPCYFPIVAQIQVKNVPQELHDKLRELADEDGCSMGDIILLAIEREFDRREHLKNIDEIFANPTGLRATKRQRRALMAELRRERDSR